MHCPYLDANIPPPLVKDTRNPANVEADADKVEIIISSIDVVDTDPTVLIHHL